MKREASDKFRIKKQGLTFLLFLGFLISPIAFALGKQECFCALRREILLEITHKDRAFFSLIRRCKCKQCKKEAPHGCHQRREKKATQLQKRKTPSCCAGSSSFHSKRKDSHPSLRSRSCRCSSYHSSSHPNEYRDFVLIPSSPSSFYLMFNFWKDFLYSSVPILKKSWLSMPEIFFLFYPTLLTSVKLLL